MPSDFDQALYRRLIDEEPDPPAIYDVDRVVCDGLHNQPKTFTPAPIESWRAGYKAGTRLAARISAERQATPTPSDHDLGVLVADVYMDGEAEPNFASIGRAVREALGAWPQPPEGWWLDMLKALHRYDDHNRVWAIKGFRCRVCTEDGEKIRSHEAEGPTWQAALTAAVEQAREGGK